jgi:hypothetical protein
VGWNPSGAVATDQVGLCASQGCRRARGDRRPSCRGRVVQVAPVTRTCFRRGKPRSRFFWVLPALSARTGEAGRSGGRNREVQRGRAASLAEFVGECGRERARGPLDRHAARRAMLDDLPGVHVLATHRAQHGADGVSQADRLAPRNRASAHARAATRRRISSWRPGRCAAIAARDGHTTTPPELAAGSRHESASSAWSANALTSRSNGRGGRVAVARGAAERRRPARRRSTSRSRRCSCSPRRSCRH